MSSTKISHLTREHYNLLILGCGMSGISAAHYLSQKQSQLDNFHVGLIEAQDRFGGRMFTKHFGRGYVELGANWCHGATHANPVFNLASSYGLIEQPMKFMNRRTGTFLHSSGIAIDQRLAGELYDHLKEIELSTEKLPASDTRNLDEYIEDQVCQLKDKYPAEVHSLIDSAAFFCKHNAALHGGDTCHQMSAWGYGACVEIEGDVPIAGGYCSLLERMIAETKPLNMSLNEEVLAIDLSEPVVQVRTCKAHYTCDYLLVTFSLGVLKACHKALFTPPLPSSNVGAIERLGFGRVAKIYLEYDKPFWQPGMLNCLKFYPDLKDLANNDNEFMKLVNCFEEIPTSSNVLVAWVKGEDAVRIENYSKIQIIEKVTDLLRTYTGDPSIPEPKDVLMSEWNGNRYIRGGYSYPSMATTSREDFSLIAKPLKIAGTEKVFFAGEATHPHYYSTVHGARLSGIIAAEQIMKSWLAART